MLIVDAHQDLAWNIATFGRDYTRSVAQTRHLERASDIPRYNGDTLLGWPDYQRGQVAVVFGTLFAAPERWRSGAWDHQSYQDIQQAHQLYSAQLDHYERLCEKHDDKFRLVRSQSDLEAALAAWENPPSEAEGRREGNPVGIVLLMENAEGVREPAEVEMWRQRGVRLIGPAWAGTRFCGGTNEPGPLTKEGYALLEAMSEFGLGLDLSHMDQAAAMQALDVYPGAILASHSNALALIKGADSNRHLPDHVIQGILERDGVIGVTLYNPFLVSGWRRGEAREYVSLGHVAAHIDYICQMAGDALHVGIGSDFDGGFGLQSTPLEIDSVADLQKLAPLLAEKGYSEQDIAGIFGRNWLRMLRKILPG